MCALIGRCKHAVGVFLLQTHLAIHWSLGEERDLAMRGYSETGLCLKVAETIYALTTLWALASGSGRRPEV